MKRTKLMLKTGLLRKPHGNGKMAMGRKGGKGRKGRIAIIKFPSFP